MRNGMEGSPIEASPRNVSIMILKYAPMDEHFNQNRIRQRVEIVSRINKEKDKNLRLF